MPVIFLLDSPWELKRDLLKPLLLLNHLKMSESALQLYPNSVECRLISSFSVDCKVDDKILQHLIHRHIFSKNFYQTNFFKL